MQNNKGGIKKTDKLTFIQELESARIELRKSDESPKSEPDQEMYDSSNKHPPMFKTKSLHVNHSEKVKSGMPDLKVDFSKSIKNLKFTQNRRDLGKKEEKEVPLNMLESYEILQKIHTERVQKTEPKLSSLNMVMSSDVRFNQKCIEENKSGSSDQ